VTPEEVCAVLECVHLDIPWDPELVRVWSVACVLRAPDELARHMGVDEAAARAAWKRLAEAASQRLRQTTPAPTAGATWEVLVYHEDDVVQEPRAFSTRCEAVEAAFEAGWNSGALRAVLVERDAAGALRSTQDLRFG
jgi:hypothetical protein